MGKIEIKNISYSYKDNNVLDDVSFEVLPSELVCLVGSSGCGKSTLLRLISGLEKVQKGSIFFDGKLIANEHTHVIAQQRHIGMVFQQPALFPHLSVRKNIEFGISHIKKNERGIIVDELLELIDLQGMHDRYPHMLSGGQQQRVALARALAPKPIAMLLDEPFANLDDRLRRKIREDVVRILKKHNVPIIMVTHDPEEALVIADKMVLLSKDGHVKQVGSPDSIHNHPKDMEAASFFGVVNIINSTIKNNVIHTSIGDVMLKDYAPHLLGDDFDGKEVSVVTRPEGIRLVNSDNPANAIVTKTRHTGAGWLVTAILDTKEEMNFHHIYGECPKCDDRVCVLLESSHVFIFESRPLC